MADGGCLWQTGRMESPPGITIEQARDMLRGVKLRCTACRLAVLQHLSSATAPLSHAEVSVALAPRGYDKSTIYRSLVEIADAGLATRLELGDHVWRFELAHEPGATSHPHFMCTACGKVECLTGVQVRITGNKPPRRDVEEVLLKGRCVSCNI